METVQDVKSGIGLRRMEMKVIYTFVVIVVIVAIAIPAYVWNETKSSFTQKNQYELNWKLQLPAKFKELDQYTNQGGFHGEGARYTIFKTNEKQLSSILQPTSGRRLIEQYSGDTLQDGERNIKKKLCYFVEDLR